MQNKDWIKAGEDILHSVMDAVEHQDFSGLSRNIQSTVNDTLGYVNEKINEKTGQHYNATQEWLKEKRARDAVRQEQCQRQKSAAVELYKKNPPANSPIKPKTMNPNAPTDSRISIYACENSNGELPRP